MGTPWWLAVALLVPLIGIVDWVTGPELSTSILYLAPIVMAAMRAPHRASYLVSVVCASLWLALDLTSGATYAHPAVPYWNAAVRLGIFVTVAGLVEHNRRLREAEQALARTDPLTGLPNSRAFFELLSR